MPVSLENIVKQLTNKSLQSSWNGNNFLFFRASHRLLLGTSSRRWPWQKNLQFSLILCSISAHSISCLLTQILIHSTGGLPWHANMVSWLAWLVNELVGLGLNADLVSMPTHLLICLFWLAGGQLWLPKYHTGPVFHGSLFLPPHAQGPLWWRWELQPCAAIL